MHKNSAQNKTIKWSCYSKMVSFALPVIPLKENLSQNSLPIMKRIALGKLKLWKNKSFIYFDLRTVKKQNIFNFNIKICHKD